MPLYIVGTPIGNLKDISIRALEILKNADVILVEKWADSIKLLNHYEIRPPLLLVYNEQNKKRVTEKILKLLQNKNIALITSAGMPAISDPGADLVKTCYKNRIPVIPIPGPSALSLAISVCGFRGDFLFISFLPKKPGQIEKLFSKSAADGHNLVFFESPFRLLKTLEILESCYPGTNIFIGKEMTKMFERYLAGKSAQILEIARQEKKFLKGEFTLVINFFNKKRNCDG